MENNIRVIGRSSPFGGERVERVCGYGQTISEIIESSLDIKLTPQAIAYGRVWINGKDIDKGIWHRVRPKPGTKLYFQLGVPQNGNILRVVLTLAVVVAAAYLGPLAAGFALGTTAAAAAAAGGAAAATFGAASALATGIIGFAGMTLLNALVPIRQPSLNTRQPSPTYSISGNRNSTNKWGAVPVVLGRHRMAPLNAARPFTESSGSRQWLRQLFCWGYGPLTVQDLKIGETPIESFGDADHDPVEIETREGLEGDAPVTLYPGEMIEDPLNVQMEEGDAPAVRRSATNADELSVEWTFPNGLVKYNKKGKPQSTTTTIRIEMRLVGDVDWVLVDEIDTSNKKLELFRIGHRWTVAQGQYDVRLSNIEDDSDTQNVAWTALRTIRTKVPYTFPYPLAVTAIRIEAQGNLNGVVDTLTGIVSSRCPDWDAPTQTWITRETSNPASLYRYVQQHPANAKRLSDLEIAPILADLQDWHEYCQDLGLEFNQIRDFQSSVPELLADIAAAGHASPQWIDGRRTVIIDRPRTIVSHLFSPENSWGFKAERQYRDIPDAWRIRFVDREGDWNSESERIVYRNGVAEEDAVDFEAIEFPGITDPDRIWIDGQRRFLELEHRADTYTLNADWESIQVTRGDLVRVAHDVPKWGVSFGRVADIDDTSDPTTITVSNLVTMLAGKTYVIRFQGGDGTVWLRSVANIPGETDVLRLVGAGDDPAVDDSYVFGEQGSDSKELIIQSIEPAEDMKARIIMVDHAPEISDAENLTPPAWVPSAPTPLDDSPATPVIVSIVSGTPVQPVGDDGTVLTPVVVGVAPGSGSSILSARFEIQHRLSGTFEWAVVSIPAGQGGVSINDYDIGETVQFRVRAISGAGKTSLWSQSVSYTVVARTTTPPNVTSFTYSPISNGVRHYEWILDDPTNAPPDIAGYRIRYKLGTGFSWNDLTPLHTGLIGASPLETTVPQVRGLYTFGIVAVNRAGAESATPLLTAIDLPNGIAPNPPVITTTSFVTNDNTPAVAGTADAGTTVHVYANSVEKGVFSVIAGAWSGSLTSLADATYTINATAVDTGGHASDLSNQITGVIDTAAPSAPVITTSSPFLTTDTTPHIDGTAEASTTVAVYTAGSTLRGTTTANGSGIWGLDLTTLPIGVYSVTAKATDAAGNTSVASSALALTVQPAAPAITTSGATIGNTNPVVAGNGATAGASVKVYVGGVLNQTVTADGSGNWTATLSGLAGGANSITATQTVNSAESPASGSITLTVVWYDPDASGHADFKGGNYRLSGSSSTLAGIFDTITTSAQIVTNTDGSLHPIAANAAPLCDRGLELWEPRTNRCTNRNAAPTDLTGVTLSGDPAATLTRVDESASMGSGSILNALLTATTINGFVYKLDNSTGSTDAFATISGTINVTGACRGSIVYRGSAGRIEIGGATAVSFGASTPYVRVGGSRTAAATTEQMRVAAPAGATIYFILNQLEAGAFDTAPIVVNAAIATRNAPLITHTVGADFSATEGFFGLRGKVVSGVTNSGIAFGSLQTTVNDCNVIQFVTSTAIRGLTQVAAAATGLASQSLTATNMTTGVYGYKANDFGFSANGLAAVTDTSGALPTGTPAKITVSINSGTAINGVIEQVKWGTTKPSNANIQAKSGWTTST